MTIFRDTAPSLVHSDPLAIRAALIKAGLLRPRVPERPSSPRDFARVLGLPLFALHAGQGVGRGSHGE